MIIMNFYEIQNVDFEKRGSFEEKKFNVWTSADVSK